jgi:fructosamine-3-kinase
MSTASDPGTHLQAAGFPPVVRRESLSGGCIGAVRRWQLADGATVVVKTIDGAPGGMLAGEAAGLAAIAAVAGGPRVPAVLGDGADWIVLEDLGSGSPGANHDDQLGHALASMHLATTNGCGCAVPTWCGATAQDNTWNADPYDFFARQRLLPLARRAREQGRLDAGDVAAVEGVCERLPQVVPQQPIGLIHGDLWSGNVHTTASGQPALIDPAAHYGWPEADLAMSIMFGSQPQRVYDAYAEVRPLDPGWRDRCDLYNLYHYLNHTVLFGGGYAGSVRTIARRYGD